MFEQTKLIHIPKVAEVMAIERKLKGERLELAQKAFDVLHDLKHAQSDPSVAWKVNNLPNLLRGFDRVIRESHRKDTRPAGCLNVKVKLYSKDKGNFFSRLLAQEEPVETFNLGLASVNVVTTAGVNFVVDAFQALETISNFKYHQSGTNNTAEAVGDTDLNTATGSRVTGTQTEGGSANIYETVATLTYGSTLTIQEHGLFSASTAGTLFDRSIFTGIGVDTSTSIEFTYDWTCNSGG